MGVETIRNEVADGNTGIRDQATAHHTEKMAQGISESNRVIEAVKHMMEPPAKKLRSSAASSSSTQPVKKTEVEKPKEESKEETKEQPEEETKEEKSEPAAKTPKSIESSPLGASSSSEANSEDKGKGLIPHFVTAQELGESEGNEKKETGEEGEEGEGG